MTRSTQWFVISIALMLSVLLIGCGGYVKKDELEKQLSSQRADMEQKIQLAQDSATTANDKAEKALAATKQIDKIKDEIMSSVDSKIESAIVAAKSDPTEIRRIAEEVASKTLDNAKQIMMSEDEKVKMMAKEAAEKAMSAAMEADRRAQEALREAEIAKTLPRVGEETKFIVYFDPGKVNIKPEGIAELEKAADMIKANPDLKIKIEGHADNTPVVYSKYRNNWLLSQARAEAVRDYLVNKLGVPADSIKSVVGFSEYKPTASNDKNNRWQNRRVEVILVQ